MIYNIIRNKSWQWMIVLTLLCLFTMPIRAAIPDNIDYQGYLTDDVGSPVNGTVSITFSLYNVDTGGITLWSDTQSVSVANGLFTVKLGGAGAPFPVGLFDDPLWLGITVDSDGEMTPRITMSSAGFAYKADDAITLEGQTAASLDQSAHVSDTGNPHSVTAIQVGAISSAEFTLHMADPSAHHSKTSSFTELTDTASDAQIPAGIARDTELTWSNLSGIPAGFADGIDNDSGGDITAVTAGIGLNGGGATGDVTLDVEIPFELAGGFTSIIKGTHASGSFGWLGGNGTGVYGATPASSGTTYGVYGTSASATGYGVHGINTSTSGVAIGIHGESSSPDGWAIYGEATSSTGSPHGVFGRTNTELGSGIAGQNLSTTGSAIGVDGSSLSTGGIGVRGFATALTGVNRGVMGHTQSDSGYGVYGIASSLSGFNTGVYGVTPSTSGKGVHGVAGSSTGITFGVYGVSYSSSGFGVYGENANSGNLGYIASNLDGVVGVTAADGGYGVWGRAIPPATWAGYFSGDVHISGTLSKSSGSFKIDHPLDPENKYLNHSFVESPDMMNVYNGNVILDNNGEAIVTLPDWFEALNKDFRYQLTAIGAPGPNLYIAQKVNNNQFTIAGGVAGTEVSWQVTGIRKDPYAEAHRIPVEEYKSDQERGFYLTPGVYGQPEERSTEWARAPQLMRRMQEESVKPREIPTAAAVSHKSANSNNIR